jgi:hypothetical protein
MNQTLNRSGLPPVPPEVWTFAAKQGASDYVYPLLELAHGIFPGRPMTVLLERDAAVWEEQYVVFEADVTGLSAEDLVEGQNRWSRERFQRCPPTHAPLFIFGLTETA